MTSNDEMGALSSTKMASPDKNALIKQQTDRKRQLNNNTEDPGPSKGRSSAKRSRMSTIDSEGDDDFGRNGNEWGLDYIDIDLENQDKDKSKDLEYEYEVLSMEEIVQHMNNCIESVRTVVDIPATTARILLSHFKWDEEKLMERLYDGDQDQLFAEARVINPFRKPAELPSQAPSQEQLTKECELCCSVVPASTLTGMECGHRFCKQCWNEYLKTKIVDEGMGHTIACPACDILVDDATVTRLVRELWVKRKYQQLITNSFVSCNRLLCWCPSPDCTNAIKVPHVEAAPVTCHCGRTFCYACGEDWHEPIQCSLLKKWIKKCNDNCETSTWIAANTKECPKCKTVIEKNGGCNHMFCRHCSEEFCWVCLGPWSKHEMTSTNAYYECTIYRPNSKAARDEKVRQQLSRESLERYLFYYDRYLSHMQSLKFESNLCVTVKRMRERMQKKMGWTEKEVWKRALDILCRCRQTLMYTYVFAYYMERSNELAIFEANQQDLQRAVEALSEYLEQDTLFTKEPISMPKVQDTSTYCDSRRKVLLGHVREGYERDHWREVTKEALPSPVAKPKPKKRRRRKAKRRR